MNNQTKQIPSIHLLHALQNQEVSIDFNIGGVTNTQFITKLSVIEDENSISLDDNWAEIVYITIDKEQVLEIEQDLLTYELTIYLLHGTITINRI